MSEYSNELREKLAKIRKMQNVYAEEIDYLEGLISSTFCNVDNLREDLIYSKEQYTNLQNEAAKIIETIQSEESHENV